MSIVRDAITNCSRNFRHLIRYWVHNQVGFISSTRAPTYVDLVRAPSTVWKFSPAFCIPMYFQNSFRAGRSGKIRLDKSWAGVDVLPSPKACAFARSYGGTRRRGTAWQVIQLLQICLYEFWRGMD